jgi:hypothetical protein
VPERRPATYGVTMTNKFSSLIDDLTVEEAEPMPEAGTDPQPVHGLVVGRTLSEAGFTVAYGDRTTLQKVRFEDAEGREEFAARQIGDVP